MTEETDLVVVAYRTNAELPVNVFVFDNSTEGLEAGSGHVFVAHGANDPALDLGEGTYKLGFDVTLDDENACADVGPVDVPVTPDVVSILVAVDENTSNDAVTSTLNRLSTTQDCASCRGRSFPGAAPFLEKILCGSPQAMVSVRQPSLRRVDPSRRRRHRLRAALRRQR